MPYFKDMDLFHLANYGMNPYAVAPAAVAIGIALLGLGVLIREQWSSLSIAFFGMIAAGAVWLFAYVGIFCSVNPETALQWARIENVGVVFIPSMVFLFSLAVTGKLRRYRAAVLGAVFISAVFSFFVLFTPWFIREVKPFSWGYFPQYGFMSFPFLVFFAALLVLSLLSYYREYQLAPEGIRKRRLRTFLAAFGIAYVGSVDFVATYGIPLYPFGYFPVLLWLGITAQAIWRYRLVDITPAFAATQILKTVSDSLLVFDHEGVIRVVNQAACELFEQPERKLLGRAIWRVDGNFFPREKFDAFMRTRVIHSFEAVRSSSAGRKTVLDVAVSGIRDEFGQPAAVVCVARDLTERKLAEEELRRVHEALKRSHQDLKAAQMQLIEAAKMESVGRLAAGIAHEVKNPLAVILQGLDYLDGRIPEPSPEISMVVREGKNAVRRADTVLRGLLDFSAIRSLELQPTNLNTVIEQALLLVRYSMEEKHIKLVLRLQENPPLLHLDRNKMEQVFVNLFINAVYAMPEDGTLTVATEAGSGEMTARVEDTGSGIPPEALPKIFEPFFTTKPAGKGTGLGLTVARSLVELQGGTLEIRNRLEGGVRAMLVFKREKRNAER